MSTVQVGGSGPLLCIKNSAADQRHLDADPDPACPFDACPDPEPTLYFDADPAPAPSFQIKAQNLEKGLT